jgi:hypothetical protein
MIDSGDLVVLPLRLCVDSAFFWMRAVFSLKVESAVAIITLKVRFLLGGYAHD